MQRLQALLILLQKTQPDSGGYRYWELEQGGNWFDLKYGHFPVEGTGDEINFDQQLGFAIATGGVISTSSVSAENSIEYKIKVTGTATEQLTYDVQGRSEGND